MTQRMVAAVRNPHVDVLGHCTGRLLTGRGGRRSRPESEFDPDAVFSACREHGAAVEINCLRPERRDLRPGGCCAGWPPRWAACFSIDTDAHAPGQLEWLENGCVRAEKYGIAPDRVINTRDRYGELAARTP